MQVDSAPDNTFLNEIWPLQEKKENLENSAEEQPHGC